jgi:hypothetical protein
MDSTIDVLLSRKSIRAFENRPVEREIKATSRFDEKFIFFENGYHRLAPAEFDEMFAERASRLPTGAAMEGIANVGQATYLRKFDAEFWIEMSRSTREWLKGWMSEKI